MKIVYRISDGGYSKVKPDWIQKKSCLEQFITTLRVQDQLFVLADNVGEETWTWLSNLSRINKLERSSIGHGAGSFLKCIDLFTDMQSNELIYFLEDDYVHVPGWQDKVESLFNRSSVNFATLYDHPDKYINGSDGGNPKVEGGGEITRVIWTGNHHWKITNSTTMSFICRNWKIFHKFMSIIEQYVQGTYPRDYDMWTHLGNRDGGYLVSPIPSLSTHGETQWLSPAVEWETLMQNHVH